MIVFNILGGLRGYARVMGATSTQYQFTFKANNNLTVELIKTYWNEILGQIHNFCDFTHLGTDMSATIKPLGVTINALRIDNSKITASLFQQFEMGCLLDDIGWPGFLHGKEEFFATPFLILGRHTYKVSEEDTLKVPFIYSFSNEVKVSNINDLTNNFVQLLEQLRTKLIAKPNKLSKIVSIIEDKPAEVFKLLASENLLGCQNFFDSSKAFYKWQPIFLEAETHAVAFNSIHLKILDDYCKTEARLISSSWVDDDTYFDSAEEKAKDLEALEHSIKETKLDVLVQRWFGLNANIITEELKLAEALYDSYEAQFEQFLQQIKSSPKVYIGV